MNMNERSGCHHKWIKLQQTRFDPPQDGKGMNDVLSDLTDSQNVTVVPDATSGLLNKNWASSSNARNRLDSLPASLPESPTGHFRLSYTVNSSCLSFSLSTDEQASQYPDSTAQFQRTASASPIQQPSIAPRTWYVAQVHQPWRTYPSHLYMIYAAPRIRHQRLAGIIPHLLSAHGTC